jgi:hypothetical protein
MLGSGTFVSQYSTSYVAGLWSPYLAVQLTLNRFLESKHPLWTGRECMGKHRDSIAFSVYLSSCISDRNVPRPYDGQ